MIEIILAIVTTAILSIRQNIESLAMWAWYIQPRLSCDGIVTSWVQLPH